MLQSCMSDLSCLPQDRSHFGHAIAPAALHTAVPRLAPAEACDMQHRQSAADIISAIDATSAVPPDQTSVKPRRVRIQQKVETYKQTQHEAERTKPWRVDRKTAVINLVFAELLNEHSTL